MIVGRYDAHRAELELLLNSLAFSDESADRVLIMHVSIKQKKYDLTGSKYSPRYELSYHSQRLKVCSQPEGCQIKLIGKSQPSYWLGSLPS